MCRCQAWALMTLSPVSLHKSECSMPAYLAQRPLATQLAQGSPSITASALPGCLLKTSRCCCCWETPLTRCAGRLTGWLSGHISLWAHHGALSISHRQRVAVALHLVHRQQVVRGRERWRAGLCCWLGGAAGRLLGPSLAGLLLLLGHCEEGCNSGTCRDSPGLRWDMADMHQRQASAVQRSTTLRVWDEAFIGML